MNISTSRAEKLATFLLCKCEIKCHTSHTMWCVTWEEGASWGSVSLALVGLPSSDGVMIKMPYGVHVLHQPALHPIFSYWVG